MTNRCKYKEKQKMKLRNLNMLNYTRYADFHMQENSLNRSFTK